MSEWLSVINCQYYEQVQYSVELVHETKHQFEDNEF